MMNNFWFLVTIAIVGGVAVTLQGQFMGVLSQQLGAKESIFITYGSGGLVISLLMLFWGGGALSQWRQAPWYAFSTGLLGLIIVGVIGYTAARLGVVVAFTVMLASQFLVAALFDHYGLWGVVTRPLDWTRALGIVVMLAGIWLTMR